METDCGEGGSICRLRMLRGTDKRIVNANSWSSKRIKVIKVIHLVVECVAQVRALTWKKKKEAKFN